MLHVRHKIEIAFIITSTDSKYERAMWNWTHVPSHAKVAAVTKGQRTVRAQIRLSTCRPAPVCMWKCVHMTFSLSVTTKVCICLTTLKWTCPPQMEKMRENWRTKREGGVRGVAGRRFYKCGYEKTHTYRHMLRNTHTAGWHKATHPQVSLLPGVAALLKHQCSEVKVHVQVRAHRHTTHG